MWFRRMARFTRKLVWGCYASFLTRILRYTYCMVILMLLGADYYTVGGESVNSVWPDYHEIIKWRDVVPSVVARKPA